MGKGATKSAGRRDTTSFATENNNYGISMECVDNKRLYWLFKTEPNKFSWDQLGAKGEKGEEWDGVRNYQARNNMRAMNVGDLGFFYHSKVGKHILGIKKKDVYSTYTQFQSIS